MRACVRACVCVCGVRQGIVPGVLVSTVNRQDGGMPPTSYQGLNAPTRPQNTSTNPLSGTNGVLNFYSQAVCSPTQPRITPPPITLSCSPRLPPPFLLHFFVLPHSHCSLFFVLFVFFAFARRSPHSPHSYTQKLTQKYTHTHTQIVMYIKHLGTVSRKHR